MHILIVDPQRCTGCHQCEFWCGTETASLARERHGAILEKPQPVPRVFVEGKPFALQCRHCDDALCLSACPSGAMRRDTSSGLVFVHEPACIACWMCVMVCPFGVITPSLPSKTAIKCDRCRNMDYPVCAEVCPNNAISLVERVSFRPTV